MSPTRTGRRCPPIDSRGSTAVRRRKGRACQMTHCGAISVGDWLQETGADMADIAIHPAVDGGVKAGTKGFAGAVLRCHCASNQVEVAVISAECAHNHVCGCTKCWKPEGALFSQVAVVPRDKVERDARTATSSRSSTRTRSSCATPVAACGVHMQGPVERPNHPFTGLVFIHTELSQRSRAGRRPTFAAFVSSIIESGTQPEQMAAVRARLASWACRPTTACRRG